MRDVQQLTSHARGVAHGALPVHAFAAFTRVGAPSGHLRQGQGHVAHQAFNQTKFTGAQILKVRMAQTHTIAG